MQRIRSITALSPTGTQATFTNTLTSCVKNVLSSRIHSYDLVHRSPGFVNTSKFPSRWEPRRPRLWSVDSSRSRRRWTNDSLISEENFQASWNILQYTEDGTGMKRTSFNYTVKAQQTAMLTFLSREHFKHFIPVLLYQLGSPQPDKLLPDR